jgi:Flp pilus assembly protein TadG
MSASSRRRTERPAWRQTGQSTVELALTAPILVLLLMSAFNISVLLSDKLIAGYATRQGARLASELGSGGGTLTTTQIDQQVVQTVLASARTLNFATVTEIDIYDAGATPPGSGVYSSTYPHNSYDGTGAAIAASPAFPNTSRNQLPPNETSIGVRILWRYNPPTGTYSFTVVLSEYTVMKAAPVLNG